MHAQRLTSIIERAIEVHLELAQFRSQKFAEQLRDEGITRSMGRVGAAGDNTAMESFLALLQKSVLNKQRWRREELRLEIMIWIERTCHRRRRQRGLGRLTSRSCDLKTIAALSAMID